MNHDRHFSVDEANALLPRIGDLLAALRDARDRLADSDAREVLGGAAPGNGGGETGRLVGEAFVELRERLAELVEIGVVLRDLDRGLVDFPSMRDGREVYLCWEAGEERVAWWHEPETGFGGRQPLN